MSGGAAAKREADVADVLAFLCCRTPGLWFEQAASHVDALLIDHANCEKKAAGNALSLLYRYVDKPELLHTLSRLAREELRHFEQVLAVMEKRGVAYVHLTPSRYAAGLRDLIRTSEPGRLIDTLLMGAVVEARSCERFHGLLGVLPEALAAFYGRLLASEARHFRGYLALARRYATEPLDEPLQRMLERDAELVCRPDREFRFHSGPVGVGQKRDAGGQAVSGKHSSVGSDPGAA
ncbi:MAG: tRNA-(ms[2]io[6]A)-hydroxylase [Pseudomonadales bacterium]